MTEVGIPYPVYKLVVDIIVRFVLIYEADGELGSSNRGESRLTPRYR